MKKTKILSALLSGILLFTALGNGSIFAQTGEAEESPQEEAVSVPKEANIIEDIGLIDDAAVFAGTKQVTRGMFAVILSKMLGDGHSEPQQIKLFSDLPEDQPEAKAVSALAAEGIINGTGDGRFYPEQAVTYEQAVKMLITMLGYREYAQHKGGYPTGYLNTAIELNLRVSSLSAESTLSGADAAKLLYKVLKTEVMQTDGVNAGHVVLRQDGTTLMNQRLNLYEIKGILSENSFTALDGESSLAKRGACIIGRDEYEIDDILGEQYLGFYVTAIVRREKEEKGGTVKSIDAQEQYNDFFEIPAESLYPDAATMTSIRYELAGRRQTAKISPVANVIYNGQSMQAQYTAEDFSPVNGSVLLIDSDRDRVYDTVRITEYENYFTSTALGTESSKITDYYEKERSIDIDPNKTLVRVLENGVETGIDSVKGNCLLSIAAAKELGYAKRCVTIIINSEKIQGQVTALKEDSISIEGQEYDLSKKYYGIDLFFVKSGIFYTDCNGEVALGVKEAGEELSYGFLFKAYQDEDEVMYIKILTQANEYETLVCHEKMRVNGQSVEDIGQLTAVLKPTRLIPFTVEPGQADEILGSGCVRQLIKYAKNEQNELTKLYTAVPEYKDILSVDYPLNKAAYKADNQSFGLLYLSFFSNSSTYYVLVPDAGATREERDNEDNYEFVKTGVKLDGEGGTQNVQAYDVKENGVASVIVKEEKMGKKSEMKMLAPFAVVTGESYGLNEDQEAVRQLVVYDKGAELTLTASDESLFDGLSVGDIIRYEMDRKGRVYLLESILDYDQWDFNSYHEPILKGSRGGTYQRQDRVVFAAVYSMSGSYMRVTPDVDKLIAGAQPSELTLEYSLLNRAGITVFDTQKKTARKGTSADIADSIYFADNHARIVYLTGMGLTEDIIIYQ